MSRSRKWLTVNSIPGIPSKFNASSGWYKIARVHGKGCEFEWSEMLGMVKTTQEVQWKDWQNLSNTNEHWFVCDDGRDFNE